MSFFLPGELVDGGAGGGRPRRTARDWLVDGILFLWAVGWWMGMTALLQDHTYLPHWLVVLDPWLGGALCLALWWRRSHPLAVALLAVPAGALTDSAFGALSVVILNTAMRLPWRRAVLVLAAYLATVAPYLLLYTVPNEGGWPVGAFALAYYLVFFAWGRAARARRRLVLRLRQDAERERADHARRLVDARRAERRAIAREMHDVLAHRISLLSVHAGALAYRTKQTAAGGGAALDEAEIAESAGVIRDNAHQALDELREVLHVLRADEEDDTSGPASGATVGTGGATRPQPGLSGIAALVSEAREAGQRVRYEDALPEDAAPPRPQLQRTAYRVVQEGLTNARKHAPGSEVTVRLTGSPGNGLTLRVSNPLPEDVPVAGIPGAGAGLTGLHERLELEEGTLHHGIDQGAFTLLARLPWPLRAP
ncbi:histidine kinase [Streptomyces albiaxialis]|uniref:histidine kinase n=1 Tax=Streptomyces albiaxialis TaxID=329523 RepID=A0ABN2VJQ5_9ACTN